MDNKLYFGFDWAKGHDISTLACRTEDGTLHTYQVSYPERIVDYWIENGRPVVRVIDVEEEGDKHCPGATPR